MQKLLAISLFVFCSSLGWSQQLAPDSIAHFPNNGLHFGTGLTLKGGMFYADYERLVFSAYNRTETAIYLKGGIGLIDRPRGDEEGSYGSLVAQLVGGNRGKAHLELCLGLGMRSDSASYQETVRTGVEPETLGEKVELQWNTSQKYFVRTFGLRIQDPKGGISFRIGGGVPYGYFVSLGAVF